MTPNSDYVTLFRGRGDCYGSWTGGCIREPLTEQVFEGHLNGTPIGVYPAFNLGGVTLCVWGCTDIDKTDDPTAAIAIRDALGAVGITSWIERTAHGWHVWVFATRLVAAKDMRRMFLAAHQVTGVPAKEVNPKQEHLGPNDVGNYVRLPYPMGWGAARARYVVDSVSPVDLADGAIGFTDIPLGMREFVTRALNRLTTPTDIARVAAYYREPKQTHIATAAPSQDMGEAARRLDRVGQIIFRDGPLPESDRSTTLLRLAHHCREAGLPTEDCRVLLEDADIRWGKFMQRGEKGQLELLKMIGKVYGSTPSP